MRPNEQEKNNGTAVRSHYPEDEVFDNGFLRVEHDNYFVACEGRHVPLPRLEFLLFSRLARSFNRVVKSEELWRAAWGGKKPLNSESLHVHMYRLRRRFVLHGLEITNMVNVGYQLGASQPNGEGGGEINGSRKEA